MIVDTYVTLDAGDKQLVGIRLRVLHEVRRRLLGGNGNEGNTLVSRLEPDDLGTLDGTLLGLLAGYPLALAALSLLLLLGSGRRGTQKTKCAGEQLTGHTLDDGDDVAGELRLNLVSDPASLVSQSLERRRKDDSLLVLEEQHQVVIEHFVDELLVLFAPLHLAVQCETSLFGE